MRIALVTDTYTPQVNGVTTIVRRMADSLARAQIDVTVVAPEYPEQTGTGHNVLRVPSLAFPPYPAIRLSLPAHRRVARHLDSFGADIVHAATEGPLGLVGRHYALRRGLPLVTSYHTRFARYCRDYGAAVLEPMVWRWIRWFHAPARLTHTPGVAAQAELAAQGIKAVVWGNSVDTRLFHHECRSRSLRHRLRIGDNQVAVLHVGRLAPEKNLEVLAESWYLARRQLGSLAQFIVAGDGPLADWLSAALPWALRIGFLDRAMLAQLYASCDLCVLPSQTETCGLVALEAMASGLPVVAADCGGLAESVAHRRSGILVPPDDPAAFAAAICELVTAEELRQSMSREARLLAVAHDAARADAELVDQYATLLGGKAAGAGPCAA